MEDLFIVKKENPLRGKNFIVISGLPGIANVSKIAVDHICESLKAKTIYTIYSYYFPNSVAIDQNSLIHLPKVELKYAKANGKNLIFVTGDYQPGNEKSFFLAEKIIKLIGEKKIKEIITLGGIGLNKLPREPKVHGALINEEYKKKLEEIGVILDGNRTVGIITGIAGTLLGVAKLKNIKGFSLLVETLSDPMYLGFTEAIILIDYLSRYLDIEIDVTQLYEKIEKIKKIVEKARKVERRKLKREVKKEKEKVRKYIG